VACGGKGSSFDEERLTVRIPVGAEEGMALRIPGRGEPGPKPNNPPGDLYVIVRTAADPRFERHGADLWRPLSIDAIDAILGTKVTVSTLDGEVEIDVPAGTQPDSVLRLKGKGLPYFGSDRLGDPYLRVEVRIPEDLSKNERQLYEKIREAKGPTRTGGSRNR